MGPSIDPYARPSLTDTVADRILRLARSAQFARDDQLPPVAEMVQMLGVSPQTLGNALEKLRLAGAVNVGPDAYVSEGPCPLFVPAPSADAVAVKDHLLDLVEALEPIEVPAAELAAVRASPSSLGRLEACLRRAAAAHGDEARNRADLQFHSAIAEASGNEILLSLQRSLVAQFQGGALALCRRLQPAAHEHAEHLALLSAIRRRDPALAAARMRAHLDGVRQAVERWNG